VTARTRFLGIDYGRVRVGLAVSDAERILASPLATYERRNRDEDAAYFRKLVEEESIGRIVVGLPFHLSGREGMSAVEARDYGRWLAQVTGLPVVFWDERFSTVEAESALWEAGLTHKRRRDRRDRVAAQIMLSAYLEAGCPEEKEE
jgi:putative Holliday junction resolvase